MTGRYVTEELLNRQVLSQPNATTEDQNSANATPDASSSAPATEDQQKQ